MDIDSGEGATFYNSSATRRGSHRSYHNFSQETFPKTLSSSSKKDFSNKFLGKEGAPVTLRCEASGVPPPTIQVVSSKSSSVSSTCVGWVVWSQRSFSGKSLNLDHFTAKE